MYILNNFYIDFIIDLLFLMKEKYNSYNFNLILINYLMKIIYDKLIKDKIAITNISKVIFYIIIRYSSFFKFIISNINFFFRFKL